MHRILLSILIFIVSMYAQQARAVFLDCIFIDGVEDLGTTNAEQRDAVQLHNCARKTVTPVANPTIPSLTWSATLGSTAQSYANQCHYMHSSTAGLGENIYAYATTGTDNTVISDAVADWASEEPYYDYTSNTCSAPNPPGTCGHYTQVVWRNTTQVGCGRKYCTTNTPFQPAATFPNWTFVVCNYSPQGNFNGNRPY
jgi:pathogenesis-related protein 1